MSVMTMTIGELLEHAERLQADIDAKRHQILGNDCTANRRAALLTQINALADRVDEIRSQCEGHTPRETAPPLEAACNAMASVQASIHRQA